MSGEGDNLIKRTESLLREVLVHLNNPNPRDQPRGPSSTPASASQDSSTNNSSQSSSASQEFRRRFPGMTSASQPKKPRMVGYVPAKAMFSPKETWTHDFCVLSAQDEHTTPSRQRMNTLLDAGLGKARIISKKLASHKELQINLEEKYPKLKNAGGYEVLRAEGGGGGQRLLSVVPPGAFGYTAPYLKDRFGQAVIYIRPLQADLDDRPLKAEGGLSPKVNCLNCNALVVMSAMRDHQKDCQGGSSSTVNTEDSDQVDAEVEEVVVPTKKQKKHDINSDVGTVNIDADSSCPDDNNNIDLDDDDASLDNPVLSTPRESSSQILDVLVGMFPQHTSQYLQVVAECNVSLQGAIDSVLDSAQRRNQQSVSKEAEKPHQGKTFKSLKELLEGIRHSKNDERPEKLSIDPNDIISDTIAYYKTPHFDGSKRLRISFIGQPGVDVGGVSRQYFQDAIEAIASCPEYRLFEGPDNRKLPAYNSTALYSGLFEVLGRLVGHSILQTSIGYPFLAPPIYWYIATGDVQKALPYVTINDILDEEVQEYVNKVATIDPSTIDGLKSDDRFISLCSDCGITTTLSEKTKDLTVQCILLHYGINRKKVLMDQFRSGLSDVGLLKYIEKHPTLFEPLFIHQEKEMNADDLKRIMRVKTPPLTSSQKIVWEYLLSFIDKCTQQELKAFVKFLTGSTTLSAVSRMYIKVSFSPEGAIFASTCLLMLQLPESVESYAHFENALRAVMFDGLFNVV